MAKFEFIEVKGLDQLYSMLQKLPDQLNRNVLRGAANAAATIIKNEVILRAPLYTGTDKRADPGRLKRAVYSKYIPELSVNGRQTYYVGVRQGFKEGGARVKKGMDSRDAFYGRFVEFGTVKWAGHPFFQSALVAKKQAALDAMTAYLQKRLPIEIQRLL